MTQLPVWAQWIDLIVRVAGTIGLGAFAAYIAYRQWRTSHERIVLDLFERRMTVYEDIWEVVAKVLREGTCDNEVYFEYLRTGDRLPMLFGDKVVQYFHKTKTLLADLHATMAGQGNPEKEDELKTELAKFFEEFSSRVVPYIRMTQKLR
jgi:hypothetical protein